MIKVIEKFGATWCSPCKVLDKTLSQVTGVEIVKYDVDEVPELCTKYKIKSLPTMLFKDENGKVVVRTVGTTSLEEINRHIKENADSK